MADVGPDARRHDMADKACLSEHQPKFSKGALAMRLPDQSKLDEIQGNLMYWGEDPDLSARIVGVMSQLPDRVAAFALERCGFVSVGRASLGITLPGRIGVHNGRSRNVWIIVLDEKMSPKDVNGVIAHEIAHAWRGDDRLGMTPKDCEVKTAQLVKEWGFTGIGADVKFHAEWSMCD